MMDGITDCNILINNVKSYWNNVDYKNTDSVVTNLDQGGLKLCVLHKFRLNNYISFPPHAHN